MTDNQQDDQPHLSDDQIAFLNSLYDYAREGKVQALSSVIDQGIPVDLPNHNGDTFLILASYREQADVVNALIARDADVNALNKRGQSPLTCAVFMQNEEISRALLDAGADPDLGPQSARATIAAMGLEHMGDFLDAYENQVNNPPRDDN
ncbi:MAG TPA: ankyrin repeat domain-containing protein [Candidatus Yaniella excrementigallinarum]|nr:ankyrin repeat domain-containing protein [Candidatus Yaniella excrementigallinarum]